MPKIILTTTTNDDVFEPEPALSDQFGLLIIIEYGDFELVVVR